MFLVCENVPTLGLISFRSSGKVLDSAATSELAGFPSFLPLILACEEPAIITIVNAFLAFIDRYVRTMQPGRFPGSETKAEEGVCCRRLIP